VALRVHFLIAVFVAPFLVVLALTGLLSVFSPQLNELVYRQELIVEEPRDTAFPLSEQMAAATLANPDGRVISVDLPADKDRTTAVTLSAPGLAEGERRTVYVDPYTATVRGSLTTVDGRPPLEQWLRDMHGNLQLGSVGRLYSEAATSWLLVILLSGLALRLGRRRRERGVREASGRRRVRHLHGTLGVWLSLGLVALTVTGLTWSNYAGARFESVLDQLDARTPALTAAPVPGQGVNIDVELAVMAARGEGLGGPLRVWLPSGPGHPFLVAERTMSWPMRSDKVSVHPYTGQITEHLRRDDLPVLAKITSLGIQAHSGTLFGLANQVVLAALMIGTLVLIGWGYRMWWLRGMSQGAPTSRRAWRRLSRATFVVLFAGAGVLAWALPALGATLLGFFVIDLLIGALRRPKPGGRVARRGLSLARNRASLALAGTATPALRAVEDIPTPRGQPTLVTSRPDDYTEEDYPDVLVPVEFDTAETAAERTIRSPSADNTIFVWPDETAEKYRPPAVVTEPEPRPSTVRDVMPDDDRESGL
jgi:uncharacterized iron-regulated membrane protein